MRSMNKTERMQAKGTKEYSLILSCKKLGLNHN
jgi:hypothetical protein